MRSGEAHQVSESCSRSLRGNRAWARYTGWCHSCDWESWAAQCTKYGDSDWQCISRSFQDSFVSYWPEQRSAGLPREKRSDADATGGRESGSITHRHRRFVWSRRRRMWLVNQIIATYSAAMPTYVSRPRTRKATTTLSTVPCRFATYFPEHSCRLACPLDAKNLNACRLASSLHATSFQVVQFPSPLNHP